MTTPEQDIIECRECGRKFNLAAQWYYDNLCPRCKKDDDERSTWPGCAECGERIPPKKLAHKRIKNRYTGETEVVPVHRHCRDGGSAEVSRG